MATIFRVLLAALLLAANSQPQIIIIAKKKAGGGGGSSVTFDAAQTPTTASSGTTVGHNHTVTNSTSNTAVVAIVSWLSGNSTITGCTHNGNAMTQMWNFRETGVGLMGSAGFVIATGSGTGSALAVLCTLGFTPSDGVALFTLSFTGVNQSTPARTAVTNSFESASPISLTVSNAASGDMVVDGFSVYNVNPTSGQTLRAESDNYLGNSGYYASSTAAATGSTNMSYTFGAGTFFAAFGAAALIPQ